MAVIGNIVYCILWFLLIPMTIGTLPSYMIKKNKKSILQIYLMGWLVEMAVFQVLATIFVFKERTFSELHSVFSMLMWGLAFISLIFAILDIARKGINDYFDLISIKKIQKKDIVTAILFAIIFTIQIVFAVIMETPNGDDSYYVTIGNIANMLDKMYTVSPYTGGPQELNFRHAMSEFPLMYAFFARGLGLHVTIIAHKLLPPFLITITYMIYYRIATSLFENDKSKCAVFMVLISCIQLFGAFSIYSSEVFFLTRTWQGKSMLANIAIPAAISILLRISKERKVGETLVTKRLCGYYLLLTLDNIFGGFCSSLGLFLLLIFEGVILLIVSIRNKSTWYLTLGFATMIPSFVYMFFYIFK